MAVAQGLPSHHPTSTRQVDNCFNHKPVRDVYTAWEQAVNKSGRPILINLCEWGVDEPWTWASQTGNSWRVSADHTDVWTSTDSVIQQQVGEGGGSKILRMWLPNVLSSIHPIALRLSLVILAQIGRSRWTGRSGGWNDLDMLMTGLGFQNQTHHFAPGQSEVEYTTEISFWALLQSPLVWAGDVLNMTDFQRQVGYIQNGAKGREGGLTGVSPF
jgi:alpha-galactosidase